MGGAVSIVTTALNAEKHNKKEIEFIKCHFISNNATLGGSISVMHAQSYLMQSPKVDGVILMYKCLFINHYASNTLMKSKPERDTIVKAQGGAIICHRFRLHIFETDLINNQADFYGGSIFDDNCVIHMANTIIRMDRNMPRTSLEGLAIYSKGTQYVFNVTIDVKIQISNNRNAYILFSGGRFISQGVIFPKTVKFSCFTGSSVEVTAALVSKHGGTNLLFRCLQCSMGFYSLDHSFWILHSAKKLEKHDIKCFPCPYGGQCRGTEITARPNFWGYKSK